MIDYALLDSIRELLARSGGQPIALPSGRVCSFARSRSFSADELVDLESELDVEMPPDYRHFLLEIGAVKLFVDDGGTASIEVYDPRDITTIYDGFFEADDDPFVRYFPIGCDNRLQELAIVVRAEAEPDNVLLVSYEYNPNDWASLADEAGTRSIRSWLKEAFETDGLLLAH